ncbi:MAG: DNA polymerase IV [Acholeplasmataceae bacterium]|nr:DNA polymerase IV [Acholeplasmataceae bacterium]
MRTILHVDLNNFYASVECLYLPELRNVPAAVAGNPANRHGIILAKNMLAKKLGVRTGEALWEAQGKAPGLVTVPPDFAKYLRFSRLARRIYYDYTDQVEPFGIDECWLDVTGSLHLFGSGEEIANAIRVRIREELGVTVSVGVSFNKIFAKLGSDLKKPDATTLITSENFRETVWPLPVEDLLYVGRSTARKLHNFGLATIGSLARVDVEFLTKTLGKWGEVLWLFANGLDSSPVRRIEERAAVKSIGNGTTCPRDLLDNEDARLVFTVLSESVAARLRDYGLKCTGVQIYLRDNRLYSCTRQARLRAPSYLSTVILDKAMEIFTASYAWQRPLRSIGVRALDLVTEKDHLQLSLFEEFEQHEEQREALEHTIDAIRGRFGHGSLLRASCLLDGRLTGFNPKEDHVIHPVSFFK